MSVQLGVIIGAINSDLAIDDNIQDDTKSKIEQYKDKLEEIDGKTLGFLSYNLPVHSSESPTEKITVKFAVWLKEDCHQIMTLCCICLAETNCILDCILQTDIDTYTEATACMNNMGCNELCDDTDNSDATTIYDFIDILGPTDMEWCKWE